MDVFLEVLNLFPFPASPVFFISEHFLKLSPSLPLPTRFSMMKTGGGGGRRGCLSEEPVPRAQCPMPAQSSQYPQLLGPSILSVLILPLAKAGKSASDYEGWIPDFNKAVGNKL